MERKDRRINVGMVKEQSRKLVFREIAAREDATRNIIARNTNLSLGTVKTVVEELIDSEVIEEAKETSTAVGRKPKLINVRREGRLMCVLVLNRRHFQCSIVNMAKEITKGFTYNVKEKQSLWDNVSGFLHHVCDYLADIPEAVFLGIGVAVPGPYFSEEDKVVCELIPELEDIRLFDLISSFIALPATKPVVIMDDVYLAAVAESRRIEEAGNSPLFYVFLSEGVGGVCIHNGVLFTGVNQFAGEIGQILVPDVFDENGGREKHLEDLIGWNYVIRRLGYNVDDPDAFIREDIVRRREQNDPLVLAEVDTIAELLARVLSYVVCVINPGIITIGGKFHFLGEPFLTRITEKLFPRLIEEHKAVTELRLSGSGGEDTVIGAATHLIEKWLEKGE